MLKKIFFLAIFLSFTFPRTGLYIQSLPVTMANILLAAISFAWFLRCLKHKDYPSGLLTWIALIYFGYVAYGFILGLRSGESLKAAIGLITLGGYGLLFFVTKYFLKNKEDLALMVNLIIVSLYITVAYGLLQCFFKVANLSLPGLTELYGSPKEPVMIFKDGWIQVIAGKAYIKNIMWGGGGTVPLIIGHKVFSTFHHGNLFGSHLALLLPLLLSLVSIRPARKRLFLYPWLVLAIIILFFTNSRGAFLAFGAGLICLLFLSPKDGWRILSVVVLSVWLFMFIISSAVYYDFKITGVDPSIYLYHNFEPRYTELAHKTFLLLGNQFKISPGSHEEDFKEREALDNLANKRFSLWRGSVRTVFKDRDIKKILFGNVFYPTPYYKFYNFYLWMIFEIGLIGVSLFSVFLGCIFVISFRSLGNLDIRSKAIVRGGLAGMAAALVHNLIDAPFCYPPILANFWILAGMVMAGARRNG